MSRSNSQSSQCRCGAQGAPQPGVQNRLKSERVQLELEANPPGGRVRKIVQRGAGGRFVQPLVLPAEHPDAQVAVVVGVPGAGEVVVTASWFPEEPVIAEGGVVVAKGVARAAA